MLRLLAELHHSRAARIRVAGGGAGGDASDTQASALGFPYVSHDMRYCREIATRSFAVYWSLVLLRRFVTVKPMIRS